MHQTLALFCKFVLVILNERFNFAFATTDQQMRLLRQSPLKFAVHEQNIEGESSDVESSLLGFSIVPLNQIAHGGPSMSDFDIIGDDDGNRIGQLRIGMRWRYTLRRERLHVHDGQVRPHYLQMSLVVNEFSLIRVARLRLELPSAHSVTACNQKAFVQKNATTF